MTSVDKWVYNELVVKRGFMWRPGFPGELDVYKNKVSLVYWNPKIHGYDGRLVRV